MSARPLVVNFKDIDKNDIPLVGGKGANLGEMTQAGFPVPPGFAVTVFSYDQFLNDNLLSEKIYSLLETLDVNNPTELEETARKIRKMILVGEFPEVIAREVIYAYKKMSGTFSKALVAVRSSATAEDLPSASFAGQQDTYLNVKGEANLLEKIRACWASLFTARAIFYRVQNHVPHEKVKISVIVQKMVESEVSGVMFSIDPVKNDKDRIIIESVWGLGEMIVQGSVVPDTYVVQKGTFDILSKEVSDQSKQLVRFKNGENKEVEVPKKIINKQKITDEEIIKLAKYSDALQSHYYFPQDTEWALERGKLYIIQTRPVTTISEGKRVRSKLVDDVKISDAPILSGAGASPGIGTGPVRILRSPKEIDKVGKGDILVAPMTSPDYVPAMKKAAAVVTDEGGQTSHAAIVSRELGVPAVVGTKEATKKLKDGQIITVDGEKGLVFIGAKVKVKETKEEVKKEYSLLKLRTATHVYVNLAEPELAEKVSKMNPDGVGLLRAEFMIGGIGIHPKEAIKKKTQGKFVERLTQELEKFCKAFEGKPVVYRATDFKTNEYRSLPGGKFWEPEEANPMLGFRGAFRYIASPEVFNLELTAISNVRKKYKNLHLMIPFVRSPQELAKVRRLVATQGLFEDPYFKFWMMVEIPVNVIQIDDFIKVGIDGVSIGSNDLTMLVTGTDRDNAEVAQEFNERTPAVLWSLRRVIRHCNAAGITCSICGQAASEYPDLVEKLVSWGITSVSVNPDSLARTREIVKEAERKI